MDFDLNTAEIKPIASPGGTAGQPVESAPAPTTPITQAGAAPPAPEPTPSTLPSTPAPATPTIPSAEAQPTAEIPAPGKDEPAPIPPPAAPETPASEPVYNEQEQMAIFNEHLSHYFDGRIQSLEELEEILEDYASLKGKPAEPQFKNEAAKRIYEFASRVEANEISGQDGLAAAQRQLRVLGLDLGKMSDRDKLFEAFLLDEQNSDLTREKATEIFSEEYNHLYDGADENILTKRKLEVAVRKAESAIKSMQANALVPQSKISPEDQEAQARIEATTREVYENVDRAMSDFEGLAIPIDGHGEFNYKLDPVKDASKLQVISDVMKDPGGYIQETINSFYNERLNTFDYEGFQAFVTQMIYGEEIAMAMLKHGMNLGKEAYLKELKNPPAPAGSGGAPPVDSRSIADKAWDRLAELQQVPN